MHITLKMMEKLDKLLEESDELITCASTADDPELKSIYLDLARCHYDGYEKLSKCAERAVERKAQNMENGQGHAIKEMVVWHKKKYDDKAEKVYKRLQNAR